MIDVLAPVAVAFIGGWFAATSRPLKVEIIRDGNVVDTLYARDHVNVFDVHDATLAHDDRSLMMGPSWGTVDVRVSRQVKA